MIAQATETLVGSGTVLDRVVAEIAALHELVERTLGVDSGSNWLVIVLVVAGVGLGASKSGSETT